MTMTTSAATAAAVEYLNPAGLNQNPAFSNVAVVSGNVRTVYIGGQDAVDADANIVGIGDIAAQTEQVLRNLRTALAAVGAGPEHVVKWNVFIVEGHDFRAGYAAFQRVWGDRPNPP
ncbi:MAG TPA: RidA family protein, partial [Mycobacterium sp.]|nr:RidA family protein [Mycobacterium sp.]